MRTLRTLRISHFYAEMNFARYEYFDLKYPSGLPQTCIDAMRHLSDRLKDDWFTKTFLHAQHLRTLLDESKAAAGKAGTKRIIITFQTSEEYNRSLSLYEMEADDDDSYAVEPAYGWFDPRVHPRQIYINFDVSATLSYCRYTYLIIFDFSITRSPPARKICSSFCLLPPRYTSCNTV